MNAAETRRLGFKPPKNNEESMGFLQLLENVVSHIQNTQKRHLQMGKAIREKAGKEFANNGNGEMKEKKLSCPIQKHVLNEKIAGVDSGFVSQSFYALDLMMLRSCGVCFTYEKGKMVKTQYVPESFSLPDPIVNTSGLEREEFHKFVSLTRLQAETQNAIELIQKTKPTALFLDGSLILHPMDKPSNDSKLKKEYEKTIQEFVQLYKTAEKNDCLLIGAIEDSRSTRLSEWIHENVLEYKEKKEVLHDAPLLDNVLSAGERSMAFPYAENPGKHPILADFPSEWATKIHACYLKPSQWDYPLRIEFLSDRKNISENANTASKYAYAQSNLHKEYAFPSVLIEADLRAGLKQEEVELVADKIFSKIGRHSVHLRRRNRRPF